MSQHSQRVGSLVSGFRIDRLVAVGGAAAVYACTDVDRGSLVAVKILHDHLAVDEAIRRRFLREVNVIGQIRHPGVPLILESGEFRDTLYIAMEYIRGSTISKLLLDGPLPWQVVVNYGIALCETLVVAHRAGIIHRDIKPSNIMIAPAVVELGQPRTVLLDFGIALITDPTHSRDAEDDLTRNGEVFGTVAYMSPEQATGGAVTPATDIYAIGLTLWEMLTGERACGGLENNFQILTWQVRGSRVRPSAASPSTFVPPSLDQVVLRAMASDPAARYSDASQLLDALHLVASASDRTLDLQEVAQLVRPVESQAPALPFYGPPTQPVELPFFPSPSPTEQARELAQHMTPPTGYFEQLSVRSASLFLPPEQRWSSINEEIAQNRRLLDREYNQLERMVNTMHYAWLLCTGVGFFVLIASVAAILFGVIAEGTASAIGAVLIHYLARTFRDREDTYRGQRERKEQFLRYGTAWMRVFHMIDGIGNEANRERVLERMMEQFVSMVSNEQRPASHQ